MRKIGFIKWALIVSLLRMAPILAEVNLQTDSMSDTENFISITEHLTCTQDSVDQPICDTTLLNFTGIHLIRANFGYAVGQYVGIRDNYFECSTFATFAQTTHYLPFFDLHYYRFADSRNAVSVGAGVRIPDCLQSGIVGVNIYYDFLEGRIGDFDRLGLGLEWISCSWAAHLNGYIPVNQQTQIRRCHFVYSDGYEAFSKRTEYLMSGVDAELEKRVWCWKNFELFARVGGYYYKNTRHHHLLGAQAGLDFIFNSYLSVEVSASSDNLFGATVQGKILLTLPFTDGLNSCLEQLLRPVKRDNLIFTRQRERWDWNW